MYICMHSNKCILNAEVHGRLISLYSLKLGSTAVFLPYTTRTSSEYQGELFVTNFFIHSFCDLKLSDDTVYVYMYGLCRDESDRQMFRP